MKRIVLAAGAQADCQEKPHPADTDEFLNNRGNTVFRNVLQDFRREDQVEMSVGKWQVSEISLQHFPGSHIALFNGKARHFNTSGLVSLLEQMRYNVSATTAGIQDGFVVTRGECLINDIDAVAPLRRTGSPVAIVTDAMK